MKGNLVVARGKKRRSLYMIADEDMISVAEVGNSSSLWHQRLGHMSEKGMKLMVSKGKIPNLKHVDVGPCEHCIFESRKRLASPKQVSRLKLKD